MAQYTVTVPDTIVQKITDALTAINGRLPLDQRVVTPIKFDASHLQIIVATQLIGILLRDLQEGANATMLQTVQAGQPSITDLSATILVQ